MQRNLLIILFIIVSCSFLSEASTRSAHKIDSALNSGGLKSYTQPTITTSPVTGRISACVGLPSNSPYIQQFSVSGTGLTGNVTATASTGFEVSLNATSGYGNSVIINESGVFVANIVYVRSAASDPAGDIQGYVTLTSPGAEFVQVAVSADIIPTATVDAINPQVVTNGSATTAVNFTGTGNSFTWTNDTPSIGLAANGVGDIPSFTAINTGLSPVTATINVSPAYAGYAYVPNSGLNNVSVINTATNKVINTIGAGQNPVCVSVSPDGTRAFIGNFDGHSVTVINANQVIATIGVGFNPLGITVTADGTHAYVVNSGAATVSVINTAINNVDALINVGSNPISALLSPDESKLYVLNQGDRTISVINTGNNALIKLIDIREMPAGMCLSPGGGTLYYFSTGSTSNLIAYNLSTSMQTGSLQIGTTPGAITVSKDGRRIYLTNPAENDVSIINSSTLTLIKNINVGVNPKGLSLSADDDYLYVANDTNNGTVSVISTMTNSIITSINVGSNPVSLGDFVTQGSGCAGSPVPFTITVNPSPKITVTGTLTPLITTYGTPSLAENFTVSGTNIPAGILITPPAGFEVSTDGLNFSTTITVGAAGTIPPTVVYIRIAATTNAGPYSGNIVLDDNSEVDANEPIPNSFVNAATLTITANSVNKTYGTTITGGSGSTEFTITGLQNNETAGTVTIAYGAGSAATDAVGVYANSVVPSLITGGTFNINNYLPDYISNEITVVDALLTITADNKTRPFGKPNPVLTASYSGFLNGDGPDQLTALPVLSTLATIISVAGQYPITVSGAASLNYSFNYVPGVLTISPPPMPLVIPNTFTPNGDGINDTWQILNIERYPNCNVQVFNSYGEKLYSSVGYSVPWDGKFKNAYLPTGAYYYIIDLKNGSAVVSGSVMIIR